MRMSLGQLDRQHSPAQWLRRRPAQEEKAVRWRRQPGPSKPGSPHGSGLGVFRWVVERTLAWLHRFRRLALRPYHLALPKEGDFEQRRSDRFRCT